MLVNSEAYNPDYDLTKAIEFVPLLSNKESNVTHAHSV